MAYTPISGSTIQIITTAGEVGSDYYLKLYEANTTTPLSMATDSTGGTTLIKAKIGNKGMPISNPLDNSTIFVPHVNQNYRLVIYTNETDADNNTTASAYVNIPSIQNYATNDAINTEIATFGSTGANHGKNLIINGDFSVNQRSVSGTVSLSAGEYGHDRFKAGSSGCTYTFATSSGKTTLTITAGSLQQVIEGDYLPNSKTVVLSWEGTAQGKIGAGSYSSSGVTGTTTGGSNLTVEFNTGTLALAQLEFGDTATDSEYVTPADQLNRCKRYFERLFSESGDEATLGAGFANSATNIRIAINYAYKRDLPTISGSASAGDFEAREPIGTTIASTFANSFDAGRTCSMVSVTRDSGTHTISDPFFLRFSLGTGSYIDIDAEL